MMNRAVSGQDRRVSRSEVSGEAATLFLSAFARRQGLSAIALANEDGLLVSGAGEGVDLDALAAMTVAPDDDRRAWNPSARAFDLHFQSAKLTLGTLGPVSSVGEAARALGRILGA